MKPCGNLEAPVANPPVQIFKKHWSVPISSSTQKKDLEEEHLNLMKIVIFLYFVFMVKYKYSRMEFPMRSKCGTGRRGKSQPSG